MLHEPYIRKVENAQFAVLMIHGIVGSPSHFKDLLPLIPEDWSVFNILLDGHGAEVEDFARTDMDKWKAQVQKQLDEILLTHRKVLIIAHSMGTLLAIREAIQRPESIASLFLLNVPLTPYVPTKTAVNSLSLALGIPPKNTSARAMEAGTSVHLTPKLWKYIGWTPRFLELLQECRDTVKRLPLLETPTFTFQSRHDELVSMRSCQYLKKNPCITNCILESSGHFAYSKIDTHILKSRLKQLIETIG